VKIAFLMRNRPDYVQRMPKGLDWFEMCAADKGVYREEDLRRVAEADAVILAHEPVNEQLLAACRKLRIVQRMGVGYETVDLEACARRSIPVCNLGDINKDALGEHSMMLMLSMARHLVDVHRHMQGADWASARSLLDDTFELQGKNLGILGFGKSGYELARRARPFGMRILYYSRSEVDARLREAVQAEQRELDGLLRESDFLAINVSLNPSTRNLIDAKALALMKPTAYLIDVARGGIVDERALADALNAGRLAGAGMDVFVREPVEPDNPLLKARNVVLTPHAAGTTKECTDREIAWSVTNVRRYLEEGKPPRWIINGVKV
jgi:phosphoglycerate dehydrogenase-like enzyme